MSRMWFWLIAAFARFCQICSGSEQLRLVSDRTRECPRYEYIFYWWHFLAFKVTDEMTGCDAFVNVEITRRLPQRLQQSWLHFGGYHNGSHVLDWFETYTTDYRGTSNWWRLGCDGLISTSFSRNSTLKLRCAAHALSVDLVQGTWITPFKIRTSFGVEIDTVDIVLRRLYRAYSRVGGLRTKYSVFNASVCLSLTCRLFDDPR